MVIKTNGKTTFISWQQNSRVRNLIRNGKLRKPKKLLVLEFLMKKRVNLFLKYYRFQNDV